jgi:hypothetical protein
MATMTKKYTLFDIYGIAKQGFAMELDDITIKTINSLSQRVGAPTYQRTPIFKKRERRQKPEISNDDWEDMRNFKTTELKRNEEGIELEIDRIRNHLNQITETNYDLMKEYILDILLKIISTNPEKNELEKVGKSIFEIGSSNKFWSKLYAKLYKDLIIKFSIMHEISSKNFNDFLELFTNIRYISSEENYDLFCDINKENEKRRSLSCFFVHLMNNGVIKTDDMISLFKTLKNKFLEFIEIENKKNEVIEIAENMVIIIKDGQNKLEEQEAFWDSITEFLEEYSNCKYKNFKSLPSKCVFSFMDLMDEL